MTGNPFDQFDASSPSANPFDQFDSAQPAPSVPPPSGNLSWGDVAEQAVKNYIPSAISTAKGIATPFFHPIDTAESLASTAHGGAQELDDALGINPAAPKTEDEQHFDALKSYFANRYGSIDNLKQTLAHDPLGASTDLAAVLSGGEALAGKATGIVGKAVSSVADVTNPINQIAKVGSGVGTALSKIPGAAKAGNAVLDAPGNLAAHIIGGVTTGAGANSIKGAYRAGLAGGDQAQAFTDSMRGNTPWSQVVTDAKTALGNMRADRNAAYRSGMADISKDATVLDFKPIDDAMENVNSINSFKGQDLSPNTTGVRQDIFSAVNKWKGLDPAEYHTPEGFDALKQQIGDIKDAQPFGTPQRAIASDVYNAIRGTIADQAPAYNDVMSDYSRASDQLSELQKELSLGPKGNPNTALRKLQSVMRDNANTSWGNRAEMAQTIADNGAPNLMPSLAGQALSTPIPRGMAKYADSAAALGAAFTHPAGLAALPLASPRLMGEAAYGLGKTVRGVSPLVAPAASAVSEAVPASYEAAISDNTTPDPALSDANAALLRIANPQKAPAGYKDGGHVHAAAAQANHEPSDAQIEAGNYKKGHISLHGFRLSIETPKGAARRGIGPDGKPWENQHATAHYGYIKQSEGADGEHHDAYVGPHPDSKRIFIVNQIDPKTKKFDEHKIIFGARTLGEARAIYDGGFSDGSGPKRRWAVHETDPAALKAWLAGKHSAKPFPSQLALAA